MLPQEVVGDARGRIVNISSQDGMMCSPAQSERPSPSGIEGSEPSSLLITKLSASRLQERIFRAGR